MHFSHVLLGSAPLTAQLRLLPVYSAPAPISSAVGYLTYRQLDPVRALILGSSIVDSRLAEPHTYLCSMSDDAKVDDARRTGHTA